MSCNITNQSLEFGDKTERSHNNIVQNYPDASVFLEKLEELKEKIPSVFEDFEKSFVLYNKDPEDNEYKQIFSSDKSNLEKVTNDLFLLENNVSSNINELNSSLARLYIEIEVLKKENSSLKKKYKLFDENANTADKMLDNYAEFYEILYLKNWAIAISIAISLGIMSIIFKPKKIDVSSK